MATRTAEDTDNILLLLLLSELPSLQLLEVRSVGSAAQALEASARLADTEPIAASSAALVVPILSSSRPSPKTGLIVGSTGTAGSP